uniref:COesterase domain-containing protein n=1 Tax=Loa loa TaxID=7209 RepID=A0A1I7VFF4_LOALO
MRIEHISLLHLLHATFGIVNEESITMPNKSLDAETSINVLPSRQTTHGEILGYYMEFNGILAEVYEAVPYAQPPIGPLRFEATKALIGWNKTRNCGKGRIVRCVQFGQYSNEDDGTEDCLYATIIIPHKKTVGSANVSPIKSIVQNFAAENIIFVAINYRLGPLGFLTASHRDLHGNYGLDDQTEAIRWIRANARNFDGNLNNIVVGGLGAGAACARLFNGVILRSGSSIAPWAVRSASTENYSARLIDYCGCGYNRTLGMLYTVECLKKLPVAKLQKAWKHIAKLTATIVGNENNLMGNTYFTPTTDPYRIEASVLPGDPMSILRQNPRMPLLIGVTNGEVTRLTSNKHYVESGDWSLNYVIPSYLHANYKQVQKAVEYQYLTDYPQNLNEAERRNVILDILSDQYFIAPAAREALLYAKKNRTVYAYIFQYENAQLLKSVRKNGIQRGASHGNDCSFIFNNPTLSDPSLETVEWNDDDRKITQQLVSQMANFVHRRNLSEVGFKRFSAIYRVATPINHLNINSPVGFYSNVTGFWHEVIPAIEQLHIAPQYRVLLQPCTMCQYPYKIPFYIILTVLILVTVGLLSICIHRQQRVRQKPTYAIVHELEALKSDEKMKMELNMP